MKKLSEILGSKKGVDLEFVDLITDETTAGDPIVRLTLKAPLNNVMGRVVTDPITQQRGRLEANDVEVVSIGKDALAKIEELEVAELQKPEAERVMPFTWIEEGKSGKLSCNLKLDVSSNLEVWVVTESFAKFGNNRRREIREQRTSALIKKINDNKTQKEFKDTNVTNTSGAGTPEPVAAKTA